MTPFNSITVENTINAPVTHVWAIWTNPEHIMQWNTASDDWHTPFAENDLRTGGRFVSRMAAKDGSMSFDFEGAYSAVDLHHRIEYVLEDSRKVQVLFEALGDQTRVVETFDAERENSEEMQQMGWQAILDNFKKYAESKV